MQYHAVQNFESFISCERRSSKAFLRIRASAVYEAKSQKPWRPDYGLQPARPKVNRVGLAALTCSRVLGSHTETLETLVLGLFPMLRWVIADGAKFTSSVLGQVLARKGFCKVRTAVY